MTKKKKTFQEKVFDKFNRAMMDEYGLNWRNKAGLSYCKIQEIRMRIFNEVNEEEAGK